MEFLVGGSLGSDRDVLDEPSVGIRDTSDDVGPARTALSGRHEALRVRVDPGPDRVCGNVVDIAQFGDHDYPPAAVGVHAIRRLALDVPAVDCIGEDEIVDLPVMQYS